jgi:acetoin utilization protein AcuC
MQREHNARVLYIDIDAHHGDGVQWIFYEDPDVLTLSFHESGAFLFPGTGFIDELGEGDGYGYSVNVPLDPTPTTRPSWSPWSGCCPAGDAFQPDVIVLQAGCDAHVLDPLTHLRCTTGLYELIGWWATWPTATATGGSWPRAAAGTPSIRWCPAPGPWSGRRCAA